MQAELKFLSTVLLLEGESYTGMPSQTLQMNFSTIRCN